MIPTPCAFSSRDHPEQPLDLLVAERGRRLVHDQDPRVGAQAPGDLDELLLGHRQPADFRRGIDRRADPLEQPPRPRPSLGPAHAPPGRPGSSPIAMFSATVRSGKSAGC